MGKKYLVDDNTGNMYDIVTEKLIPDIHWWWNESKEKWQGHIDKFHSDRYKKEWIFAYVKKFIHLFPNITTWIHVDENWFKNQKARIECDEAFKDTENGKRVSDNDRGDFRSCGCVPILADLRNG